MENKELFERLSRLGLPLLETEEYFDVNKTLSEVVKSKDIRLWEGFPVLLANSNEKGEFDYSTVKNFLENEKDSYNFSHLFLLSLSFLWASKSAIFRFNS